MFDKPTVAVIGAGFFGCTTAITLAKSGYDVLLLERLSDVVQGTSGNNTNRVHQGFHYPRDRRTAMECRDHYKRFEATFDTTVFKDFPNLYCIASEGSMTSADAFLRFCRETELTFTLIDPEESAIEIRGCSLAIACTETICDPHVFRRVIKERLRLSHIPTLCSTSVNSIENTGHGYKLRVTGATSELRCDAVVNCTYADINRLTLQLGYDIPEYQFEYTMVPVVELPSAPAGVTIMDGPFMTLFPYGQSGKFLLYHVQDSVIETAIGDCLDADWLCPERSPLSHRDKRSIFDHMRDHCSAFLPILKDAKLSGFLEAPRMVLAHHEEDDARPSALQDYGSGYFTVLSGKIDRCLDIADSVCVGLNKHFGIVTQAGTFARADDLIVVD